MCVVCCCASRSLGHRRRAGFYDANGCPTVPVGRVGVKAHRSRQTFGDSERYIRKINLLDDNQMLIGPMPNTVKRSILYCRSGFTSVATCIMCDHSIT